MIHNKNIINLGILDDNMILESDLENTYYIYYKADKDLYMYDSYRNTEFNLFNLQKSILGTLEINTNYSKLGSINLFALKSIAGTLEIIANKNINSEFGTVIVKVLSSSNETQGVLSIHSLTSPGLGTIDVYIEHGLGSIDVFVKSA